MILMSGCWEPLAYDVGVVVSPCRHSLHLERGSGESRAKRICNHAESRSVFIARDGDAAIYCKYTSLSARNLLYLQSELHEWEEQLRQLGREDAKDIDIEEAQKAAREWRHYSDPPNVRACQHRVLQEKIRFKLEEYRAFTIHLSELWSHAWLRKPR